MMRSTWIFFLIVFSVSLFAQEFTPLSEAEKELIGNNSQISMRVYQLSQSADSLILKSASHNMDPLDPYTEVLANRMLLSVMETGGVGIAAPQVGLNRRLILVQRFDKPEEPFEVFINPRILWSSQLYQIGPEGDLSFDDRAMVLRPYAIQIEYEDGEGKTRTEMLEGFTAVIYQHERDHLDGVLLTDRAEENPVEDFILKNSGLYLEK